MLFLHVETVFLMIENNVMMEETIISMVAMLFVKNNEVISVSRMLLGGLFVIFVVMALLIMEKHVMIKIFSLMMDVSSAKLKMAGNVKEPLLYVHENQLNFVEMEFINQIEVNNVMMEI